MIGLDVELWFWTIARAEWPADEPPQRPVRVGARWTRPGAIAANGGPAPRPPTEAGARPRLFVERRAYHRDDVWVGPTHPRRIVEG